MSILKLHLSFTLFFFHCATASTATMTKNAVGLAISAADLSSCDEAASFTHNEIVRMDYWVIDQLCHGEEIKPEERLTGLQAEERVFFISRSAAEKLSAAPPRGQRSEDLYIVAESAKQRVRSAVGARPCLSSGSTLSMFSVHIGIRGHPEVLADAMNSLARANQDGFIGFPRRALSIMQDAASDPDFYEWTNPAAHAQTGSDPNTGHAQPGAWQSAWAQWTRQYLRRGLEAAQAGRGAEALYFVGYALHSVQDLASRRGRTDAEHDFNSRFEDRNSDEDKDAIDHAEYLTQKALKQIRKEFGPAWIALSSFGQNAGLTGFDKRRLLGHGWTRNFLRQREHYHRGVLFSKLPASTREQARIRWCQQSQCECVLAELWKEPLSTVP